MKRISGRIPALDALELKNGLCGLAGEGLEAALRVSEGQPHDHSSNQVEAAAEKLAVQRLLNGLAPALQPARADGHVGTSPNGIEEAMRLLHGRGEIGVSKHNNLAVGVQHAIANAVAVAGRRRWEEDGRWGIAQRPLSR